MSSVKTAYSMLREATRVRGLSAVNWPLRDQPIYAAASLVGCCAVGLVAGWISRSVSMGLLASLAVASAMWQLWIPIRTEFGPRGVTLTWLRRRRRIFWRDIGHLDLLSEGLFLCREPSGADCSGLGGLFLPWGRDRAAIATFCQEYGSIRPPEWSGSRPSGVAKSGQGISVDS